MKLIAIADLAILLCLLNSVLATPSFTNSLAAQLSPESSDHPSISSVYPLNDTTGVRVPLGWSFSIGFQPDTCRTTTPGDTIHYSAPGLPDWITFNAPDITFSGTSPEYFDEIQATLVCEDGTDQVSETFLARTQGQLQLNYTLRPVIGSPRNNISYDMGPAISRLRLDKARLNDSQTQDLLIGLGRDFGWLRWNRCAINSILLSILCLILLPAGTLASYKAFPLTLSSESPRRRPWRSLSHSACLMCFPPTQN